MTGSQQVARTRALLHETHKVIVISLVLVLPASAHAEPKATRAWSRVPSSSRFAPSSSRLPPAPKCLGPALSRVTPNSSRLPRALRRYWPNRRGDTRHGLGSKEIDITLVRHGQSVGNHEDTSQFQKIGGLSPMGKRQAELLARELKRRKFDVIICSDAQRTKATLKPLLRYMPNVKVIYTPRIEERNKGVFAGMAHTFMSRFNKLMNRRGVPTTSVRPPGGESVVDMDKRVSKFYRDLLSKYRGKRVLVVTHSGVMKALEKDAGITQHPHPRNTAITRVRIDKHGNAQALLFESIKHLPQTSASRLDTSRSQ